MKMKFRMDVKIIMLAVFLILLPLGVAFADENAPAGDNTADSSEASCGGPVLGIGSCAIPHLSGELSVTGMMVGVGGNATKFNEYRDIETGVFGAVKLKYDDDKYWFKFKATDMGYETQNYRLDGGIYGAVKYFMEYNEIPHTYSLGDKTIYSGAGSNNLTGIPVGIPNPQKPFNSWNNLDYAILRQQEGGGVRLDLMKPFYVEFSGNREDRTGTRPISLTSNGSSGPLAELPQPINYVTETFRGEVGYITKPLFASAYLQYTDFDNAFQDLYFQNIYSNRAGLTEGMTLPGNNDNYNYGFKGSVELPLQSRFNLNLNGGETKSGFNQLTQTIIGSTNTPTAAAPAYVPAVPASYAYSNGLNWHGKMDTGNYNFVLTSNPLSFLNANIYYKYNSNQNKSDVETTTATASAEKGTSTNVPLSFRKNNAGVDLGFKLPADFYLNGGYNYAKVNRTVLPNDEMVFINGFTASNAIVDLIPKTTDNVYSASVRWAGTDFMAFKVGYERLDREGAMDSGLYNNLLNYMAANKIALGNHQAMAPYKDRYDVGSQDRDKFRVGVDFFPVDNLNLGLGYTYIKSTYPDTIIGLRNNKIDEFNADADYTFAHFARLNVYAAYENIKTYQFMRAISAASNANPAGGVLDTTTPSSNYNWDLTLKDNSYNYGAGLDIYLIPRKVTLRVQYDYVNSNGNGDFTILNQATLTATASTIAHPVNGTPAYTNDNMDVSAIDDYKKSSIQAKTIWDVSKHLVVIVGYAFEHYKYNDASYDAYPASNTITDASTANPQPVPAASVSYLGGAYSNPSYNASLAFLTLTYKF